VRARRPSGSSVWTVTPFADKEEPDGPLEPIISMDVGCCSKVQEKCSHSEGSPGDAGITTGDKKMLW
jgi:hypothetical protein